MRIKSIHMRNFKRFTDLLIHDISESAKLVVVVGPNGCGKSSLFDALLNWYRYKRQSSSSEELYYRKDPNEPFEWDRSVEVTLHNEVAIQEGCLYVRTAHRNDPDFSIRNINRPENPVKPFYGRRLIDDDKSVSSNYQRLVYDTASALYNEENDEKSVRELREELIGDIRQSMKIVFDDLLLHNISNPFGSDSDTGTFYFEKGSSKSYHYKNLSGGEKAAFDLLLDLYLKRRYFADAIYCIDEIETHLHTKVQGILLREIAKVVPNDSQLWVTTHSLGILRAAQEMDSDNPGSVCVLDFDGIALDVPGELGPATLDRVSWEKMLSITLDDLSDRVAPEFVVVCEGSTVGNRRKDFDADIYEQILRTHEPSIVFVSGGSSQQVANTGNSVRKILERILPSSRVVSLTDRDSKKEEEVAEDEGIVLQERNLESYLLADEVIESLLKQENKLCLLNQAMKVKSDALKKSIERGNPPDDLKSAAGEIYVGLKQLLELERPGNNTDAFLKYSLAPLIVPGTDTYQKLKAEIVDRVKCKRSPLMSLASSRQARKSLSV